MCRRAFVKLRTRNEELFTSCFRLREMPTRYPCGLVNSLLTKKDNPIVFFFLKDPASAGVSLI